MSFEPRLYQKTAVRSVIDGYQAGKRQLLLRLPTGAGKTVISALLIEELMQRLGTRRILFLAHRRELIDQTAEKIGLQIGTSFVTIEQAERRADSSARVVVASVQTLAGRLDGYSPGDFGALIVDECHHAYAKTWMDVISHFGSCKDTLLLGLTATSRRSDGRCVSELFSETAFEISLSELQEQGYLVPMDYYTIEASLGLGAMALDSSGDFQTTLLGKIMNSPEVRELTVRACLQTARHQKTIAFCASVEHAKDLAADFAARGISSAFVSGETQDRSRIIEAYRAGEIQFLSNFGVLTEGFDDPSIECVLLARPTTSPLVYSQCLGRGLRSHPGKRVCTVIDIVDRQRQHLQYNAFEAAGLKRSWRGSGKDPLREAAAIARIRVADPAAFLKLRQALSLQETHKILMGLDPRLVFAGIDGMPLVRYQAVQPGAVLESEACIRMASEILNEARLEGSELSLEDGAIQLALTGRSDKEISPYLTWHLEQATGWKVQIRVDSPKVEERIPEFTPLQQEIIVSETDEAMCELEYVRDDWSGESGDFAAEYYTEDFDPTVELSSIKPSKSSLGLKARLDRLVQEAKGTSSPSKLREEPELEVLDEAPLREVKKRLSIQERMKAMKAESLGRNI